MFVLTLCAFLMGGLAGLIGGPLLKSRLSVVTNITLGITGGLTANLLLSLSGTVASGWIAPHASVSPTVIVSTLSLAAAGACLLLYVVRLFRPKRRSSPLLISFEQVTRRHRQ